MSYILDALRKADAQRARDPARGIHAQAITTPVAASAGPRRGHWIWGAVAFVIVAGAAWLWIGTDAAAPPPVTAAAPTQRVDVIVAAPVAPLAPLPAAEVQPPAPPVVVAPRPAAVTAAPKPPVPVASVPAPATVPPVDRVYSLADLPADVQQVLPKFSVSGGVYSENAAQRMLIVNGQVFSEGSEIAPGVLLEQIRARVAVLKFRGFRITQPF